MYLRFVTMDIDPDSRVPAGIFHAAYDLYYESVLSGYEREQLRNLLNWFGEHLPAPNRFARGGRKMYIKHGVCWFKNSARAHLEQIWEMVALLESNGVWVQMIKTDRPGGVVYEDDWQIVAVPSLPKRR